MRLTLEHSYTANGRSMLTDDVRKAVLDGIDDPSDAIIPAETSLYRAAHRFRYDKATKRFVKNNPDAAYASPWWSTYYDFNKVTWASADPDQSVAARAAYAIHNGWGGDCSLYASIVTTTDLSVWYGLGRTVIDCDFNSPQLSAAFASDDVLQIYIPGFRENAKLWTSFRKVLAFEDGLSNGRGFQGDLPTGLRPVSPPGSVQMSLFDAQS